MQRRCRVSCPSLPPPSQWCAPSPLTSPLRCRSSCTRSRCSSARATRRSRRSPPPTRRWATRTATPRSRWSTSPTRRRRTVKVVAVLVAPQLATQRGPLPLTALSEGSRLQRAPLTASEGLRPPALHTTRLHAASDPKPPQICLLRGLPVPRHSEGGVVGNLLSAVSSARWEDHMKDLFFQRWWYASKFCEVEGLSCDGSEATIPQLLTRREYVQVLPPPHPSIPYRCFFRAICRCSSPSSLPPSHPPLDVQEAEAQGAVDASYSNQANAWLVQVLPPFACRAEPLTPCPRLKSHDRHHDLNAHDRLPSFRPTSRATCWWPRGAPPPRATRCATRS